MNVLITGAGFIGMRLHSLLRQQPDVFPTLYSRRFDEDVRDAQAVEAAVAGRDLVIHTANDRHGTAVDIVRGARIVRAACARHGAKLIHLSSLVVYASNQRPGEPMDEAHPWGVGGSPYVMGERLADAESFEQLANNVVVLRPARLFGTGQPYWQVVARFIHDAVAGNPITIYGDGSNRADLLSVDDCVAGIWAARDLPGGTICNVSSGRTTSLLELAESIRETARDFTGVRVPITHVAPHTEYPAELCLDYRRLHSLTGWEPTPGGIEPQLPHLIRTAYQARI